MSQTNHKLEPDLETMFLTTSIEYSYLSSTTVQEVAAYGGDVSQFVPEAVAGKLESEDESKKESVTMSSRIEQIIRRLKSTLTKIVVSAVILDKDYCK